MKTPQRYVFGVDLDGVCADFYDGIRPLAAEWLGVREKTLPKNVSFGLSEWGMDRAAGGYLDFHKWAVSQKNLFEILRPIRGCPQAMRRLSKNGVYVRIITHRLVIKHFHKQAIQQTVDWLDRHGIPYWDLCLMQEKSHVGANIYIDDAEENIRSLTGSGCKVIVFTNSTNLHLRAGLRARNWAEVESIVMKDLLRWDGRPGGKI